MAYSHSRLRNTLALIRVLTGLMLLVAGAHKISSLEFAQIEFPALLRQASNGAAVGFYADFLDSVVRQHTGGWAVLIGLTELFIGVGLLLGLAVRPVSLVGIFYTVNFMLAAVALCGEPEQADHDVLPLPAVWDRARGRELGRGIALSPPATPQVGGI
jgi:uncharacterized membrane protein YphA (DoxX/SURF4 family)